MEQNKLKQLQINLANTVQSFSREPNAVQVQSLPTNHNLLWIIFLAEVDYVRFSKNPTLLESLTWLVNYQNPSRHIKLVFEQLWSIKI